MYYASPSAFSFFVCIILHVRWIFSIIYAVKCHGVGDFKNETWKSSMLPSFWKINENINVIIKNSYDLQIISEEIQQLGKDLQTTEISAQDLPVEDCHSILLALSVSNPLILLEI